MNTYELLPHQFPFLLVDRVTQLKKGKKAEGLRQLTENDFFCMADGRLKEIFILEALAQLSGIIVGSEKGSGFFAGIRDFVFSGTARVGDTLCLKSVLNSSMGNLYTFQCSAEVNGSSISEGRIILYIS